MGETVQTIEFQVLQKGEAIPIWPQIGIQPTLSPAGLRVVTAVPSAEEKVLRELLRGATHVQRWEREVKPAQEMVIFWGTMAVMKFVGGPMTIPNLISQPSTLKVVTSVLNEGE